MMTLPLTFRARVIHGSARGRTLGVPTLNLDMTQVPDTLEDGVFACRAIIDDHSFPATMHKGPRPTFGDIPSCEVHLIDHVLPESPESVTVEVVAFLRPVTKFPSAEALAAQMHADIAEAKQILGLS